MARNPRRQEAAAEPARIALEHAVRRWEAELENDRKLSHRENGLMAFVAAVLGLGLFKLELFAAPDRSGWMWTVRGLVGISLVLLFAALAMMLLTPGVSPGDEAQPRGPVPLPGLSSGFLRWPEERGPYRMSLADPRAAVLEALELTTRAATSLYSRNLDRRTAIDRSQSYLFWSAIVAGLAFSCYVWSHAR